MRKVVLAGFLLLIFCRSAFAFLWSSAIPAEIHLIPDGLVLLGEFDNTGVICASGPKAIFLPRTDALFKEKLTLAITAKASGKKIRVLIDDPIGINCIKIPTLGYVPVANYYFWQLID